MQILRAASSARTRYLGACAMGCARPNEIDAAMSQALAPCHRAEVGSPADHVAFHDGVVHRQGFAHYLLWGLRVETPQAAGRGLHQTVQVVHLDGVMGKAYPGRQEPLGPAHPRLGLRGLSLGQFVGVVVQQGVQKGANAVAVQVLGNIEPPGQ